MRTRIPADESERRHRSLLLLLGIVVAGSTWQIASRTGLAEPAGTGRRAPAPIVGTSSPAKQGLAQVDFASRLGLARPGTPSRRPASGWLQKPLKPVTRAPIATESFASAGSARAAESPVDADSGPSSGHEYVQQAPVIRSASGTGNPPSLHGSERPSVPSSRAGWSNPEAAHEATTLLPGRAALDSEDEDSDDEDSDEEDSEDATIVPQPGDDSAGQPAPMSVHEAQLLVLGPAVTTRGDVAIWSISVENAMDIAHAPIRLVYDPDVLELVSVSEGSFLSSDGTATRFLSRAGSTAGILDISISRVPPARGIDGGGVLCSVTFLAKATGSSPMVLAGSRLLDSSGRRLAFARSDADVAVK